MTAVTFGDARLATRDALRTLLAGTLPSTSVGTKPVDPQGARPYVRVQVDGSSRSARLDGQQSVRVSIWGVDEGSGFDLARRCEALLLEHHGRVVRGYGARTGPLPTEDPDTGDPLSYFTLTARLVPTHL